MVKLRVPVRVRRTLQRLAIGLETVVHLVQQLRHHAMTGPVFQALEFGGQLPQALTGPPQRGFRIAPRYRFHQRFQIALQGCVPVDGPLAARPSPPDSLAARRLRSHLEFGHSADHRPTRQPAGAGYRRYSAKTHGLRFGCRDQTPRPLIQHTSENLKLARQS